MRLLLETSAGNPQVRAPLQCLETCEFVHHLAKNHPIQTATGWVCSSLRLIQYYGFLFIFETRFHYIAQASHELVTASSCLSQWVPGLLVWATKPGYISSSGLIQNQKPDPWEFTLILALGSALPVTFYAWLPKLKTSDRVQSFDSKNILWFCFSFHFDMFLYNGRLVLNSWT